MSPRSRPGADPGILGGRNAGGAHSRQTRATRLPRNRGGIPDIGTEDREGYGFGVVGFLGDKVARWLPGVEILEIK